jgi:hypothetical protein
MPRGTSIYDQGYGIYIPEPKGTVASFGKEFDVPGPGNRHATSAAFLFQRATAAKAGLPQLKRGWVGINAKAISADRLGQDRWGLSSQVGLPKGFHFGWRIDNVDLLFSYRGERSSHLTPRGTLALAERVARRVHC